MSWHNLDSSIPIYYEDEQVVLINADCRLILPHLPKVDLVLTDPPYGIGQKYSNAYDDKRDGYWNWFKPLMEEIIKVASMTAFTHRVAAIREMTGWDHIAIWHKPLSMGNRLGNSMILPHWEPIFLYGIFKSGVKSDYLNDVLSFNPEHGGKQLQVKSGFARGSIDGTGHPVPKPLGLMLKLITVLSLNDSLILDPFCGSGTTLVAAKQLGRRAIGIEIELAYVKIAVERLKQTELFGTKSDQSSDVQYDDTVDKGQQDCLEDGQRKEE